VLKSRPSLVCLTILASFSFLALNTIANEVASTAPIGQMSYQGRKATLRYQNIWVTLDKETSQDRGVCHATPGISPASCEAFVARGVVGKRLEFTMFGVPDSPDRGGSTIELRRLDPTTSLPQVVFSFFTGGAHCCMSFQIATTDASGGWHIVDAGQVDAGGRNGYVPYAFVDIDNSGSSELVGEDDSFLYAFTSYGGSFEPTRILKLEGLNLTDVTRNPEYRGFLVRQLRGMEDAEKQDKSAAKQIDDPGINGYLAGWVAQKSLLGQAGDAWHTMLDSYSHNSTDGLASCHVDNRVWDETAVRGSATPYRHCPEGQEYLIPFPEALAIFLVKHGYLTPDQSGRLGYNVAQIEADKAAKIAAATREYEDRGAEQWYGLSTFGDCVKAITPSSPAELISADRADGLIDSVLILKYDDGGKPVVVRVGKPQPGNMGIVHFYFRGSVECGAYLKRQQQQMENLK
jgi:hypothetical protein